MSRPDVAPPPGAPARSRGKGRGWRQHLLSLFTFGGWTLALAGVLLMGVRDPMDLVPFVFVVGPGAAALFWVARRLSEREDQAFVRRVVVAALLVRVGLAIVFHYELPVWIFAPDQFWYQDVGIRTLRFLRGEGTEPWQIHDTVEVGYYYWNAFLYWIFGYRPLAAKLANCVFGAGLSVVAYRIAGEVYGRPAARTAALLVAFFPSLVLWSTQNLRDPVVLLLLAVLFLGVIRLRKKPGAAALVVVVLTLALLAPIRDYLAVMAVMAVAGGFLVTPARGLAANLFIGLALFGLAVLAYQQLDLGAQWVESASLEAISEQRRLMATGGTGFRPEAEFTTPLQGLQFLPVGLTFFLLAPFPWQIGSLLSLLTVPEQLLWYALLPFVVGGLLHLVRRRLLVIAPLLIFLAVTMGIYSLVEGNAGTAYRHRSQLLPFLLIFAAVGLEHWRHRRGRGGTEGGGGDLG